ncbi:hypothetical protein [Gordonia alkaliphila]
MEVMIEMNATTRDMYAEVDTEMFSRALRRSRMSYQELADEASLNLRRIARAERRRRRGGVPETISKALIGQFATGAAKTTHELRGIAIEEALGMSPGDLFVPVVVRGTRTTQRQTA